MTTGNMVRAAVVALSLAAGGVVAATPAQAAPPNLSFEFSFGNNPNFRDDNDDYRDRDRHRRCLSDERVVRLVRSEGFRNIDFRSGGGREIVRLRATKGNWIYSVIVDRCPGSIIDTDRIRRR